MIKAVVDTNVIVSANLNKNSPPGKILEEIYDKNISLSVDDRIMKEYARVLNYEKFGFDKIDVEVFMHFLRKNAEFTSGYGVLANVKLPPDDMIFMEVAIASKTQFLITGNTRHFDFKEYAGCRIINPAEFIKING
jgi:uncharacterized protein